MPPPLSSISGAIIKPLPSTFLTEENPMSWEQRGSQQYYYRVRRGPNGQLTKTYYGTGPAAQRAAQEDNQQQALRQQAQIDQQRLHHLETQLTALTNIIRMLF